MASSEDDEENYMYVQANPRMQPPFDNRKSPQQPEQYLQLLQDHGPPIQDAPVYDDRVNVRPRRREHSAFKPSPEHVYDVPDRKQDFQVSTSPGYYEQVSNRDVNVCLDQDFQMTTLLVLLL